MYHLTFCFIPKNKVIEYNAVAIVSSNWLSEEHINNSWTKFRNTTLYNPIDNKVFENDLFYNLWFIDNFWSRVNISDILSQSSTIKKVYEAKVQNEFLRIMIFYFPMEYAICKFKSLFYWGTQIRRSILPRRN